MPPVIVLPVKVSPGGNESVGLPLSPFPSVTVISLAVPVIVRAVVVFSAVRANIPLLPGSTNAPPAPAIVKVAVEPETEQATPAPTQLIVVTAPALPCVTPSSCVVMPEMPPPLLVATIAPVLSTPIDRVPLPAKSLRISDEAVSIMPPLYCVIG